MLSFGLGNDFVGYNGSSPCYFGISSRDPAPSIRVNGPKSEIKANLSTEIFCKKQPDDAEFNHIVNLVTLADIVYDLETITENVTFKINVKTITLSIPAYENSTIGDVNINRLWYLTSVIESFV